MGSSRFNKYLPASTTARKSESEREAKIKSLEKIMLDMDYRADYDILCYRDKTVQRAEPRRREKDKLMTPEEYTLLRTTQLLEERDRVSQQLSSLKRVSQVSSAFAIGIRKIPDEILDLIFREYVEMDLSPWALIDVCTHWRNVAFATPHLWNSIRLERDDHDSSYARWRNGETGCYTSRTQPCRSELEFMRLLEMSGTLALDVVIQYLGYNSEVGEAIACLRLLNAPIVINRVRSLEVDIDSRSIMDAWAECFLTTSFHRLEHLIITSHVPKEWQSNLIKAISMTSTRLRTLKVHLDADKILLPEPVWLGIRSLQLYPTDQHGVMDKMTQKFPQVEELMCLHDKWPHPNSTNITLPKLVHASFCDPSGLRSLPFPVLQTLRVLDPYRSHPPSASDIFAPVAIPELQYLEVETTYRELWLRNFSMPKLTSLRLIFCYKWAKSTIFQWTSNSLFSTLRTLVLEFHLQTDDAFAAEILDALSNLTSFTSVCSRVRDWGVTVLCRLLEYDGGCFLCCPKLEELILGTARSPIFGKKTALSSRIEHLIEKRKRYGAPLLKAEIYWNDQPDARQYILNDPYK
ncbi:hypothetical protein CPB86DRAFT_562471 [Serendipita vermifera]|nr:hypothetical protein CPB86DRAFT_562471 [Serendipita vermifera]